MAPTVGIVGRTYIPGTGEGQGASSCPGASCESAGSHVLSMTSSNNTEQFCILPYSLYILSLTLVYAVS